MTDNTNDDDSNVTVIEENGNWRWKLYVKNGEVTASKAIKYDGVLKFTTEDVYVPRTANSQSGLDIEEVVANYVPHTETPQADLIEAVRMALNGEWGMECQQCGETHTDWSYRGKAPVDSLHHSGQVKIWECDRCGNSEEVAVA